MPTTSLWLLREKLNQATLIALVIEMKLFADKISEHAPPPDTLFPMPGSGNDSMAQLIERLSAGLGAENVVQMVERDDHRPEAAMTVETYQSEREAKPKSGEKSIQDQKHTRPSRPTRKHKQKKQRTSPRSMRRSSCPTMPFLLSRVRFWILEAPQKLLLRNERPFYRRPLKLISRTERIEAGWWDGNRVQRDYYLADDDTGRMFWVYRERLTGFWFLHGFFG